MNIVYGHLRFGMIALDTSYVNISIKCNMKCHACMRPGLYVTVLATSRAHRPRDIAIDGLRWANDLARPSPCDLEYETYKYRLTLNVLGLLFL